MKLTQDECRNVFQSMEVDANLWTGRITYGFVLFLAILQ
jgi:hypothetical protein